MPLGRLPPYPGLPARRTMHPPWCSARRFQHGDALDVVRHREGVPRLQVREAEPVGHRCLDVPGQGGRITRDVDDAARAQRSHVAEDCRTGARAGRVQHHEICRDALRDKGVEFALDIVVPPLDIVLPDTGDRPSWPSDGLEQIRLVRDVLARVPAPAPPDTIAAAFDGRNSAKRRERVRQVLETLVATGSARTGGSEGQATYFLPK